MNKKKTFNLASNLQLFQGEAVIPRKGKYGGLKIFQRFHFSSALKRMSVVCGYTVPGTSDTNYIATIKVSDFVK